MGGTSTDVPHFDGELERTFETEVAGVRMRAPMRGCSLQQVVGRCCILMVGVFRSGLILQ